MRVGTFQFHESRLQLLYSCTVMYTFPAHSLYTMWVVVVSQILCIDISSDLKASFPSKPSIPKHIIPTHPINTNNNNVIRECVVSYVKRCASLEKENYNLKSPCRTSSFLVIADQSNGVTFLLLQYHKFNENA